jgi:hypothetical protein
MSAAVRELYDKLPALTDEELHLASCPIVERDGRLLILDEVRHQLISLKED